MASNPTPSMSSGPFPVPNATVPFWRTELHELDSHRSTAELPSKQDIAIIGAGFAGVTAAYYLQKETNTSNRDSSSIPSITILEAREACSGATGRNGGHLRPDPRLGLAARIGPLGLAAANEIAAFEYANAAALAELATEEGLVAACDLARVTSGDVYVDADQAAAAKAQHDELLRLGCPTVEREVTYHGTPEEAERVSSIKGAKAAFTFEAAIMWPYKFVMGLLAVVVRKGANLQTHTPVLKISESADAEGYWTLTTPRGATKARKVLFATNGYTGGVLPLYRGAIIPMRGTVGRVVASRSPPWSSPAAANENGILGSCAPRWAPRLHDYYGVRPDGSLIVGGGWRRMRDGNHEDEYVDVFDDSTLVPCMEGYFEGWAEETFRGWEDAGTKVDQIWTGIMGDTPDELPHIGRVPSKSGQFICAGFNGHGMPNVLLCAKGVAKVMNEDCAFSGTGIPACYETNAKRLQI
ncbi:hypothetical protein SLS62_001839 [Diatrype stigma]|uniref:FAD dependent oxidoreductase domain-containing protein n=1 Tax=Diatrype stigma TaxID=117547 RepID=A0AAN9YWB2_9PEZI